MCVWSGLSWWGLFQFTGTNQNRLTGCATLVCGEWKVPGSNLLEPSLLPQLSAATIVRRAGTGLWLEEDGSSAPSLSPPAKHPPLPLPLPLTWALPLAECWDSFTEAAGCQESRSPRKAGQMYVGHCESEGGFSFSLSLLFFSSFLCLCSSLAPSVSATD